MADCPQSQRVGPYFDGELAPAQRDEVERHLAQCADCRRALVELGKLSEALAATPRLSQIAMHRLHAAVDAEMDRGLLRGIGAVGALAACVVLASALWMSISKPARPQAVSAPPWVDLPATATESTSLAANTPAAEWYLSDSLARANEGP